ncbi:PEP-CTERM sorting domain-containing protein [Deefgea rivuli]|uniref:PEP-CTERM sorting domain-containing protein n=1 Tax=Deefgea rivuli TaxID=400948 RepID=UPI0004837FB4|nr:PEP-CTERM sorting domain-containing protein [Deefgea rivuli]
MKFNSLIFLCLTSLQAQAEIIQHHAVMDDSFVAVRAGQQRNGTLAIEQIFSHTTTSAQDALARAALTFNDGSPLSGTRQRGAIATFSASAERSEPSSIPGISLPVILPNIGGSIPPITPAVPEPETYALMALGLGALYFRKRAKK